MIRVLHSVSNMDRAGIETVLMNYYRHIDRNIIQFDFLCNKQKQGAYDDEIESLGGRIFRTPGLNPLKFFKYQKYMKELFVRYPEYKIVHAHNGALGVYSLICATNNGIENRIFHAHGASINKDFKLPLKLLCKAFIKKHSNYHWACGIGAAKCYYGKESVKKGDYKLINNAIDLSKFRYNPEVRERVRALHGLQDQFVIGHVGRFMEQKNHSFLLDIFKECSKLNDNAVLVLLGDGELQASIEEKAKEIGLKNKIFFIGNVGNAYEWYQAFDVFVLPSIWEGLPVVGVEAQAASLPCFFSSAVTEEIKILTNAEFIGLNESAGVWAENIIRTAAESIRDDSFGAIRSSGYDIVVEAEKLQKLYSEMVR